MKYCLYLKKKQPKSYNLRPIKYTYAILPEIASAQAAALPGFCRCKDSRPPSHCHFRAGELPTMESSATSMFEKDKKNPEK